MRLSRCAVVHIQLPPQGQKGGLIIRLGEAGLFSALTGGDAGGGLLGRRSCPGVEPPFDHAEQILIERGGELGQIPQIALIKGGEVKLFGQWRRW